MTTPSTTLSPADIEFLESTFAKNRAIYGGITMELDESGESNDEPNPDDEGQVPSGEDSGDEPSDEDPAPEDNDESEDDSEAEESDEDDEKDGDDNDSSLSHDDALKALSKVRKSEAKMRRRLRDAEDALKNATTPEQVEEIKQKITSENAEETRTLLVENVALKHKLPPELADALKGNTREELEEHAKVLAKFAPGDDEDGDDPDLDGGLAPKGGSEEFDPRETVRQLRSQQRRW